MHPFSPPEHIKTYPLKIISWLKTHWLVVLCIIVGIGVRIFLFGNNPPGLNQDEASIGYDAWSILNFGIDRNGIHNPVHLIAWGSGQNALYAYLAMPFIYLLGLTVVAVRSVNLIFGILSLFIFYLLAKKVSNKGTALLSLFLLVINPWHIMASRWALESNLFPAIFLLAVLAMVWSPEKKGMLPLSFSLFALCLYTYGPAYFVVPMFLIIVAPYLLYHRKVRVKELLISCAVFIVTAFPILLFLISTVRS